MLTELQAVELARVLVSRSGFGEPAYVSARKIPASLVPAGMAQSHGDNWLVTFGAPEIPGGIRDEGRILVMVNGRTREVTRIAGF
jgi:hypothetical protein